MAPITWPAIFQPEFAAKIMNNTQIIILITPATCPDLVSSPTIGNIILCYKRFTAITIAKAIRVAGSTVFCGR